MLARVLFLTLTFLIGGISICSSYMFDCGSSESPEANRHRDFCKQMQDCSGGCFSENQQCLTCARVCLGNYPEHSPQYGKCNSYCPGHLERYCMVNQNKPKKPDKPLKADTTAEPTTAKPQNRQTEAQETADKRPVKGADKGTTEKPSSQITPENSSEVQPKSMQTAEKSTEQPENIAREYPTQNHFTNGITAGTLVAGVTVLAVLATAAILFLCCRYFEECHHCHWIKEGCRATNQKGFEQIHGIIPRELPRKCIPLHENCANLLSKQQPLKHNPLSRIQHSRLTKRKQQKPNPLYDMNASLLASRLEKKSNPLYASQENLSANSQVQPQRTERYGDRSSVGSSFSSHTYVEILE